MTQFNYSAYKGKPGFVPLITWLNKQFADVAAAVKGPVAFDAGIVSTTKTIKPNLARLTKLTLAGDAVLTLALDSRAGADGEIEITQDATGGHQPTWMNVVWADGIVPGIATGAGKRTLLAFMCNGDEWVGGIVAKNY